MAAIGRGSRFLCKNDIGIIYGFFETAYFQLYQIRDKPLKIQSFCSWGILSKFIKEWFSACGTSKRHYILCFSIN